MKKDIPAVAGTYALIFKSAEFAEIQVGKLGKISLQPGFYVYIGSAFGSGGLKARVARHLKKHKKLKWHIDYIREYLEIIDIYFSTEKQKLECIWAAKVAEMGAEIPLIGFGSSDCKCLSHLFYSRKKEVLTGGIL